MNQDIIEQVTDPSKSKEEKIESETEEESKEQNETKGEEVEQIEEINTSDLTEQVESVRELYEATDQKLSDALKKFSSIFTQKGLGGNFKNIPMTGNSIEAARMLVSRKRIVILTGAGINTSLGIPNIQADEDYRFYINKIKETRTPRQMFTNSYF